MEKILKKQTKEQVLNNFKRFKELDYNLEDYVPNFYEDTINLFQDDIKELERLSSFETTKSVFINKLTYKKENINSVNDFREFVLKHKPNIEDLELFENFDRGTEYNYNAIKTDIGGRCAKIWYYKNNGDDKPVYYSTQLVVGNAFRNPFDTMQTIFHEFCHAMQFVDKSQNKKENTYEFDKTYVGYFINTSYVAETEADLFGCLLLLIKALSINDKEIIEDTKIQVENLILNQSHLSPFAGYFSYPILKDFLYNEEKLNELNEFIKEDRTIDILKLKNFTKELTLNKQKEYYEDLFKDNEIDELVFNERCDNRKEKIQSFLEQYKESKFVKDYTEFRNKCKEHQNDEVYELESKMFNLQKNIWKFNNCPLDKQNYFKKFFEEERDNLENALDEFELKERKVIIEKK